MNYWNNIYVILAENLCSTFSDPINAKTYLKECLNTIIDIDSQDDGSSIVKQILCPLFNTYISWIQHQSAYRLDLAKLVSIMNKFTINNYERDLETWVNSLIWTNDSPPTQWLIWSNLDN